MGLPAPECKPVATQVLLIELFGGIFPASMALKSMNVSAETFFCEFANDPLEVASVLWPEARSLGDVHDLQMEDLARKIRGCPGALVWLTGACGNHSGRHTKAKEVLDFIKSVTSNYVFTFECTRMDDADRAAFDDAFGAEPIEINNRGFAPMSRPRWWWIGGRPGRWPKNVETKRQGGVLHVRPPQQLVSWDQCILPGYRPCSLESGNSEVCFRSWTTRQKRHGSQFEDANMVVDDVGRKRRLLPCEEEKFMGYPADYTAVLKKADNELADEYANRRHNLLGTSWSLFVTVFIASIFVLPNVAKAEPTFSPFYMEDEEAFSWGLSNCPYIHDRASRDLQTDINLPPDWAEMNAHGVGGLAEKVQGRKHGPYHLRKPVAPLGPVSSLPKCLPPEVHFRAGCQASSPMEGDIHVPDDLDFAIRTTIGLGGKADAWRRNQMKMLKLWFRQAQTVKEVWSPFKSKVAEQVAPGVEPFRFDLLGHSIKWPDLSLPAMVAAGAAPLGRQEHTGVFRSKVTEASLGSEEFNNDCAGYMQEMLARPPPRGDQVQMVFELSAKEQEAGLLSEWRTAEEMDAKFGSGRWRALPRYAIQQGEKWRLIDNGRAGEHNATYEADETIHTTCTAAGVAAAARFRLVLGKELRGDNKLSISTQDMWKAYRQIPCHESQLRFMNVMVWHPVRNKWVFGESSGLLFGITGAVLAFNRVPAFAVAVARRWLGIPVQNFFDDFRILDIQRSKGSANRFFRMLMEEILGYRIDAAKEQAPSPRALFVGNIEDYHVPGEPDVIMVRAKEGRRESLAEEMRAIMSRGRLTPGEAKSIRGKLIHYANACAGRVGKGILHHINECAKADSPQWSTELGFNLEFVLELLALNMPRRIPLSPTSLKKARVWSDASFHVERDGTPQCKLCAILFLPGSVPEGIVSQVPRDLLDAFNERKQQIHMGELLAPMCALFTWGEFLRNASTIFYVDNMGVICNIVNGSSRTGDAGTLTFALHVRLATLGTTAWWEWVQSESNCSDGGSRVGTACPVARSLGISMREIQFPGIPRHFMRMSPKDWVKFWEEPNS